MTTTTGPTLGDPRRAATFRSFTVPGKPCPAPRPYVARVGTPCRKCHVRPTIVVTPGTASIAKRYGIWQQAVKGHAILADVEPIEGPLDMVLAFRITPAKSNLLTDGLTLRKGVRALPTGARDGDCDNLAKGVLDALEGLLYANDSSVTELVVYKRWALDPLTPGVTVYYRPTRP